MKTLIRVKSKLPVHLLHCISGLCSSADPWQIPDSAQLVSTGQQQAVMKHVQSLNQQDINNFYKFTNPYY